MIDIHNDSGEIEMRTMAENEMPNPWNESGCTASMDVKIGVHKILSIAFDHVNGYSYADFDVPKSRLIVNRMDLLTADDYLALTKIIIQRLTAKQVPI